MSDGFVKMSTRANGFFTQLSGTIIRAFNKAMYILRGSRSLRTCGLI